MKKSSIAQFSQQKMPIRAQMPILPPFGGRLRGIEMKKFMKRVREHAVVGLLSLAATSAAIAQQPSSPYPYQGSVSTTDTIPLPVESGSSATKLMSGTASKMHAPLRRQP